jgi:hypothetical protein
VEVNENFPSNIDLSDLIQFNLTQRQWIALTFGYYAIEDIFYEIIPSRETTRYESYKRILEILFPQLNPVWDYFDPL